MAGSMAWAAAMVASVILFQWWLNGLTSFNLPLLAEMYFFGGIIGWITALPVARLITYRARPETRFAAYFFGLSVSTISFTAFLFAMHYRLFYSQWHEPIQTLDGLIAFLETGVVAVYQFMVLGMPQFVPVGFPALVVASHLLTKRMR